jgi:hypothetical protein
MSWIPSNALAHNPSDLSKGEDPAARSAVECRPGSESSVRGKSRDPSAIDPQTASLLP